MVRKAVTGKFRDRIVAFKRLPAEQLVANPKNFRTHPPEQQAAMKGILTEVGIVGAVLARALPDGRYELLDGHLRREELEGQLVPTLIVDVDEAEGDKVLATHDMIGGQAELDFAKLDELVAGMAIEDPALLASLEELRTHEVDLASQPTVEETAGGDDEGDEGAPSEETVEAVWQVIVECNSKAAQGKLAKELRLRGYQVRRRRFVS